MTKPLSVPTIRFCRLGGLSCDTGPIWVFANYLQICLVQIPANAIYAGPMQRMAPSWWISQSWSLARRSVYRRPVWASADRWVGPRFVRRLHAGCRLTGEWAVTGRTFIVNTEETYVYWTQLSIPTHAQLQHHRLKFIKNHLKNSYMFRSTTIFRELQCPR